MSRMSQKALDSLRPYKLSRQLSEPRAFCGRFLTNIVIQSVSFRSAEWKTHFQIPHRYIFTHDNRTCCMTSDDTFQRNAH
jgi:hypothetical protein